VLPAAGRFGWQLAVPRSAGLAGVQLRHQVLQLVLDPSGQISGLHSSNGLLLTIGSI